MTGVIVLAGGTDCILWDKRVLGRIAMRLIIRVVPLLALVATPSFAGDKTLDLCTAGGYYAGAGQMFLSGLAMHMLHEQDVFGTQPCSAAWSDAYKAGESFSRSGKFERNSDEKLGRTAYEFSERVYAAIAKNMER